MPTFIPNLVVYLYWLIALYERRFLMRAALFLYLLPRSYVDT